MSSQLFEGNSSDEDIVQNSTRKIALVQIRTNIKLDAMAKL